MKLGRSRGYRGGKYATAGWGLPSWSFVLIGYHCELIVSFSSSASSLLTIRLDLAAAAPELRFDSITAVIPH